jgi:hypothetical protein
MRNIKSQLTGVLVVMFFTGCITYKADSSALTDPDYNQRVKVTDPHYDGVLNPIGVASIAGTTIAGGYFGYQSDLIKYNSGTEQVTSKIGNAVIGAAIGFGTSYLANRLFGWGRTKPIDDPQKWVYKANKKMNFISGSISVIYVIPKSVESEFLIKNITDANQFASVFKNSTYSDKAFKTGIDNCKRDELPPLVNLFSTSQYTLIAKEKYIETSPTYEDIQSATAKYADVKKDYENNFLGLINKSTNAIDFKGRYTKSTNFKQAYFYAFRTENQSKENLLSLNKSYLADISLNLNDLTNQTNLIQRNIVNSCYLLSEPKSVDDIVTVYNRFKTLKYAEKNIDVLNTCFSLLDNNLNDGDEVIWNFRKLSDRSIYPTLQGSNNDISEIITQKLTNEANRNVSILSQNQLSNANSQWESWKEATYTAGIVGEKGAMFVLYGEVQNSSKYSIPLEITANASLIYNIDLGKAARLFGISATKPVPGTQTSSFYIPSFSSHSKGAYAIRLDFKDNYQRGGINIFDMGKILIEANLVNVTITSKYNYFATNISENTILEQQQTQNFVINGIPDRKLVDLRRGGDVNKEKWEENKRIRDEQRRLAAIRWKEEQRQKKELTEQLINSGVISPYKFEYIDDGKTVRVTNIKTGHTKDIDIISGKFYRGTFDYAHDTLEDAVKGISW